MKKRCPRCRRKPRYSAHQLDEETVQVDVHCRCAYWGCWIIPKAGLEIRWPQGTPWEYTVRVWF